MAFESTIVENDLDPGTQQFLQGLRADTCEHEPDLSVDGLSESVLARLLGALGLGAS